MRSLNQIQTIALTAGGNREVEPRRGGRTIMFTEGAPPVHQEIIQCKGCIAYPLFKAAGQRHLGDGVSDKKFAQGTTTCERLIREGSCQVQANISR